MIYEFRTYVPNQGKADALLARFQEHTMRIFPQNGIEVLGLFRPTNGEGFSYLTRFVDEGARSTAWAAFGENPEWKRVKQESEVDGPLLKTQSVAVLASIPAGLALG